MGRERKIYIANVYWNMLVDRTIQSSLDFKYLLRQIVRPEAVDAFGSCKVDWRGVASSFLCFLRDSTVLRERSSLEEE